MDNQLEKMIMCLNNFDENELESIRQNNDHFTLGEWESLSEVKDRTSLPFHEFLVQGLDYKIINEYPDVSKEHWAYDYIIWGYNEGILFGYPDGFFRPENLMTQAEFLAVLMRYKRWQFRSPYPGEHWAEPYYEHAKKLNWLEDLHINIVTRSMAISYKEASKIICKSFAKNVDPEDEFSYLISVGVIHPIPKQENITRAELVAMLYRINESEKNVD